MISTVITSQSQRRELGSLSERTVLDEVKNQLQVLTQYLVHCPLILPPNPLVEIIVKRRQSRTPDFGIVAEFG